MIESEHSIESGCKLRLVVEPSQSTWKLSGRP